MAALDFRNTTTLSSERLLKMVHGSLSGWSTGDVAVRIRYSRGADFSGTCYYKEGRIFVNVGRHLRYPYSLATNLARTQSRPNGWVREIYRLIILDAYQLVSFVFRHELYHLLVRRAGRNMRQKESMCDRFAAGFLVDQFGLEVLDERGKPVARELWDFQDLEGFVQKARSRKAGLRKVGRGKLPERGGDGQMPLFPAE